MDQKHFKNMDEVLEFAKENEKILVIKDGCVLDVTTFAKYHPGQSSFIQEALGWSSITKIKTSQSLLRGTTSSATRWLTPWS